ncbi:hypothetical protein B0A50_01264 [Salinomyces thailandicus]|uniref:RCC1-like domain-containing protein n=1 Tax=Salinomyces thailandicus TaxID=706561 RepID=A0A4U0U9U3_9PEZI|nr:hypothetical protein B0A50_01264 [Salinomyces thailandica]
MLYAFGSNGSGQLGVGHKNDVCDPQAIRLEACGSDFMIKQIAAGGNHTLYLSTDGRVAVAGSNSCGQCGPHAQVCDDATGWSTALPVVLPSQEALGTNESKPVIIEQVAATWSASILLTHTGGILVAGEGLSGELGLGHNVGRSTTLQYIPHFPPECRRVVQITACMAHVIAVLDNGDVYGWGKGSKGQLGDPTGDIWSPRKIQGITSPAVRAVCGKDFTCLIGDQETGKLTVLGMKTRDRFGLLSGKPATVPNWKDIVASWGSVYIVLQNGALISFGRNDHGQLGPELPDIKALAAGSEHCLAISTAGGVLAWGWGEHGNCGEPTDANGDVKARWNEMQLPNGQKPSAIAAGCATSFVVSCSE